MGPVQRFVYLMRIVRAEEIARRYFVMNAFDGALVVMGLLSGVMISGKIDVRMVVNAGLGASLAMGISGAVGALLVERAERTRDMNDLERHLFTDVRSSHFGTAMRISLVLLAIIDGSAPALAATFCLIPMILADWNIVPPDFGLSASFVFGFFSLFVLGLLLGRISKENPWIHGVVTVAAGVAVMIIIFVLG